MVLTRSLRWTGNGISNGRQRLFQIPMSARQYSVQAQVGLRKRPTTSRQLTQSYTSFSQQSRSISLFGWGSKPTDIATSETLQTGQSPNIGVDALGQSKTIKASSGTSESPDVTQLESHPPTPLEPEPLEKLQQSIVEPGGDGFVSDTVDIASAPERIGYLKEVCGLDFGWGPSSCMEWLLEHYHISLGLSWTAAIALMAVTLRTFMIPALVSSARQQTKMREANPIIAPLREEYRDAMLTGDRAKAHELQLQIKHIHKEYDINIMKAFVPMIIQIPFGYGAWRVLRNCGSLPVPGFVTEAWLWTSDLSFSDPYLLAPAISSFTVYYTMKMNMRVGANAANQSFMQLFSTVFPVLSFVFMLFQPGSVQLYFLSSTFCGLVTAKLMQAQFFRNMFGLGPLPNAMEVKARAASAAGAASSSSSTITKPPPGGLRRRPPFVPQTPVSQPAAAAAAASSENRSVIDKGVDSVKGKWAEMKQSASKIQEETMGKMSTREEKSRQERLDKYEAEARARIDEERERRNQINRSRGREGR